MIASVTFSTFKPRNNFRAAIARKRGESNFLLAFKRAYLAQHQIFISGTEFALSGYGIADVICVALRESMNGEGSAISLENIKEELNRQILTAFELKLDSWKRALYQAYRYSYFANRSIVVLPTGAAASAQRNIELFKQLKIGLWEFNADRGICQIFTPEIAQPKSPQARQKAIELILRKVNFRKFAERPNPAFQGDKVILT